jgi:integrase/recombinase XerD
MSLLAQAEYPPTPLSASPRQATTDDQLVTLWLHGRAPNTQRAYAADADRFRAFVAKPLPMVTLGDLRAFADSLSGQPARGRARSSGARRFT